MSGIARLLCRVKEKGRGRKAILKWRIRCVWGIEGAPKPLNIILSTSLHCRHEGKKTWDVTKDRASKQFRMKMKTGGWLIDFIWHYSELCTGFVTVYITNSIYTVGFVPCSLGYGPKKLEITLWVYYSNLPRYIIVVSMHSPNHFIYWRA